jgi:hypothetical protein
MGASHRQGIDPVVWVTPEVAAMPPSDLILPAAENSPSGWSINDGPLYGIDA